MCRFSARSLLAQRVSETERLTRRAVGHFADVFPSSRGFIEVTLQNSSLFYYQHVKHLSFTTVGNNANIKIYTILQYFNSLWWFGAKW